VKYRDHYEKALNPAQGPLKNNLLEELRSYLNLNLDDEGLYQVCQQATNRILEEWKKEKIDVRDPAAVTSFYVNKDFYCYELIGLEIDAPIYRQEQLFMFVDLLKSAGKLMGCDYGSGIGTLGIYFNQNGLLCDFADVSETNLNFVATRLKKRGLNQPRLINLLKQDLPSNEYDFITAFDVIEHVAEPLELIKKISEKLKPGGIFIFNLLYHDEHDSPHILRDPNPIRKNMRGYGFSKVGSIGEFKVYKKVVRPDFVNSILRSADTAFWDFKGKIDRLKKGK
jgi:2-polyprenyl-3-methyl-5-hydroxy-6-metoxy-1,4-benzoquinol methylase